MTKFMLMLLAAAAAWAQMPGPIPGPMPPEPAFLQLARFLDLSRAQMLQVQQANAAFALLVAEKSRRAAQVNQEIAEETAKSPLDPMALGLRYVELETIRREIGDEERKTHERVLAILNDAQKAKLKTLEDAMKLQPVICEAQTLRLIEVPFPGNVIPAARVTPTIGVMPVSGGVFSPACVSFGFSAPSQPPLP